MLLVAGLGLRRSGRQVLRVNAWQLQAGQFAAVLGPNGAGKSTLLRLLAGEWCGEGALALHGRPLHDWSRRSLACHLGFLPQSSQLSLPFTAAEVVAMGLIPLRASRQQGARLVQAAMQRTGSEPLAHCLFNELSGGERQRVQLARVLVQLSQAEQAPLLLLDEPVSAQDLAQQHAVLRLAATLAHDQGWGVVAILHDLNLAARYCDRLLVLNSGEVVADGTPGECLDPERIEAVWGYRPDSLLSPAGFPVFC